MRQFIDRVHSRGQGVLVEERGVLVEEREVLVEKRGVLVEEREVIDKGVFDRLPIGRQRVHDRVPIGG